MKKLLPIICVLVLASCGGQKKSNITLSTTGQAELIVLGVNNIEEIKTRAQALGIKAKGSRVLTLKGDSEQIAKLQFSMAENFEYFGNEPVIAEKQQSFDPKKMPLYLAKKDFGLIDFWKTRPQADGRGVKVGVIDDGISPHQEGFIKTSTGERKFLKKSSSSTFTVFDLKPVENGYEAEVDETRPAFYGELDLNADGEQTTWKAFVNEELSKACVDVNENGAYEENECAGSFSTTGAFVHLKDPRFVFMFEINKENKTLRIFQPEKGGDSHGEGVASVMAGYKIGGLEGFDGVAPGSQILDYDLSEYSNVAEENEYTLSTFLEALDWLGSEGAKVVNISYSLFFTSAKTQSFMNKALEEIITKHNMVVSFSAGNNGPGLGSLNRRGIYPSSALIAGAYVSKELDEYVHGVTGLPEEGRVIYYSSRGPGLGAGPTLISPLSSLTNSTPDGGHRAFSGTSSASPALAGAAAALISAVEQEGLEFDAPTLVHALRLSGKRLKAEPFIFQGNGLPQIGKALAIYKQLVAGKKPMNIKVEASGTSTDGQRSAGIFLKASKTQGLASSRISLTAEVSKLAPASAQVNLLTPVRIAYSKGISGSSNLWVSSSTSSVYVDIDPAEMLGNKLEAFGEIKIYSSLDNTLLAAVPVTVVNDLNVQDAPEATFELGAQQGLRFPLNVPAGVKGFKVKAQVMEGDPDVAAIAVYDPNHIRLTQRRTSTDLWVDAQTPGFWQVGVFMTKGTPRGLKVKVSIEPIQVELATRVARADSPKIQVENFGAALNGKVSLTRLPETVANVFLSSNEINEGAKLDLDLEEGEYTLNFTPSKKSDLEYLYANCSVKKTDSEGKVALSSSKAISVDEKGASVSARCMPFDKGADFGSSVEWHMKISRTFETKTERIDLKSESSSSASFSALETGAYTVELEDAFGTGSVRLGIVHLF